MEYEYSAYFIVILSEDMNCNNWKYDFKVEYIFSESMKIVQNKFIIQRNFKSYNGSIDNKPQFVVSFCFII